MSTASQTARRLAEEAEREQETPPEGDDGEDGQEGGGQEGDGGTEPGDGDNDASAQPVRVPLGEKEIEARLERLEREKDRHTKRVLEITEGDVPLYPCAVCGDTLFVGFTLEPHVSDANAPESARHEACPDCQGHGRVQSGSVRPEYAVIDCPSCSGWGYTTRITPVPTLAAAPPQPPPTLTLEQAQAAGYTVIPPYTAPAGAA